MTQHMLVPVPSVSPQLEAFLLPFMTFGRGSVSRAGVWPAGGLVDAPAALAAFNWGKAAARHERQEMFGGFGWVGQEFVSETGVLYCRLLLSSLLE